MTKKNIYPNIESNINFYDIETKILNYWNQNAIFQLSVSNRESIKNGLNNEFVFYDGPPFANGLPHYGHLLTGFIKDVYARYHTIKGKKVERKFGWDCHGLPAEMQAEKELGISGRVNIINFGIDKFNSHCENSVMQFAQQWKDYVLRQGRWVDFDNSYKTMDISFMESVFWVFKELYKQGLIYESQRVVPYSWACETQLSNFETRMDNSYRQITDKAVTCSFILNKQLILNSNLEYRLLVWTTTPWTLVSNLALAVGADIEYVLIPKDNICYVMAKFAMHNYVTELNIDINVEYSVILGKNLAGLSYYPMFKYFSNHPNSFKILIGDFVNIDSGTGIVHIAPGFGEDDQILCQKYNIDIVCPVDSEGNFTDPIDIFLGKQVFTVNDEIINFLRKNDFLIKVEQYVHNYPHCWRTDTPLIYKAVSSWYVKVESIKDKMIDLNNQINWIPSYIKDNLFGKWLENARDWSVSRNRFWGTPIPIWKSDDPNYPRIDVYGSIEEIEKDFNVKITNLHRPYIDQLVRLNPDDPSGKSIMRRIDDVFDCWFESGAMPYGQNHYPFSNQYWFNQHFPADFVVEYSAQTRGWFYTMLVLSTALFNRVPFTNAICHGVILDVSGQKLSKRLNNYSDPIDLFKLYGADTVRVTMLSSNVVKGQELLIDVDGQMFFDTLRVLIKPIWNAYKFFTMYSNIDLIESKNCIHECDSYDNVLDRYILSKLKLAVNSIDKNLSNFDTQSAYHDILKFFELLNNWYIRRNRTRFWKNNKDIDKIQAYNTLYSCLEIMTIVMSPLLPFISEEIYLGLMTNKAHGNIISVHLQDFPDVSSIYLDNLLINDMDEILDICSVALSIRNNNNIRIRQPLNTITIVTDSNNAVRLENLSVFIQDEVNVKNVIFKNNLQDYVDTKIKINFAVLGKRLPNKVKKIILALNNGDWIKSKDNILVCDEVLTLDEFSMILIPKNKNSLVLPNNNSIVILDLEITTDLYNEGIVRDLVRYIQNTRKELKLDIVQRIHLDIKHLPNEILEKYKFFIEEQSLSIISSISKPDYQFSVKLGGTKNITISIKIDSNS